MYNEDEYIVSDRAFAVLTIHLLYLILYPVLASYVPVLIILILSIVLASVMLGISHILGPHRKNKNKMSAYESGITPLGDARSRFSIRYYMLGAMFILFDIEVVFLVVWAVVFRELAMLGFVVMMPFLLILLLGFFYEWKRGVLEWE